MIGIATADDLVGVADIASWYFYRCKKLGEFNRDVFCSTWQRLLQSGIGLIIKRTNGTNVTEAIGVIVFPDPFDGKLAAQSAFWYVIEESKGLEGGMLHLEAERILVERGVERIFMTSLINQRECKVGQYLLKAGYMPLEVVYGKELAHG